MDLQGLQIFIEVSETKSFTRAGENLGYSQPTISFQIKQLEQELGFPLFDRIGHTVNLTDAGKEVLDYAQRICRMAQEMVHTGNLPQSPKGTVRLGTADSLCQPLICDRFAQFQSQYPQVRLKVITGGTRELFRMLDHNQVDIVCTLDNHIYDTAYVTAHEETVGVHFVVAADDPLAKRDRVGMEELAERSFLLTERGMSYRRLLDEWLAQNSMEIQPAVELGSAHQLCRLVAQGLGVSLLPDYVTEDALLQGQIVRLKVDELSLQLWKQVLYRKDKWLSPPMEAVIAYLKHSL